ncbi:hypothetical protein [Streptomyces sp. V1I1]|uniref:hypothetical protein n=1 Tax=Streptomyces sp. V1I1 TaxID=3042272 RepID=UPI00278AF094|nr:hypothetical protein [Streptomyces sp. V1I1]MDQ0943275.1 hypothetical protein [Streptomyces sp. V1I1]
MRYRISTPVIGFTGVSAGVNFTDGVAEIEAPVLPDLPEGKELGRKERAEREEIAQDANLRKVAYFRSQGYVVEELDEREPTEEREQEPSDDEPFDPSNHDVSEVLAHLADVDEDEQARVIAAERDGKNRKTITERSAS